MAVGWLTMPNRVVYNNGTDTSILGVLCCSLFDRTLLHLQIICRGVFGFVWKWLFSRKDNLRCLSIHHQLSIPTSHARKPCLQSILALAVVYISWKNIAKQKKLQRARARVPVHRLMHSLKYEFHSKINKWIKAYKSTRSNRVNVKTATNLCPRCRLVSVFS